MKTRYNKIICAICVACGLMSCSDFLDIKPQSEIIFEDFWNEKADVDNIVTGCYSLMQSQNVISRMIIWGEARSEHVQAGPNITNDAHLHNILKENITAMNNYTTWDSFYEVINRCNTVLKYAPMVAEKDPAYTQSDLKATIAEVTALRSLCYFYLIRTFRDVPFSREAFTDDDQKMDLEATPFDEVLDNLIADLEAVENDAVTRYPEKKPRYQAGRITQDGIHAMLCDMCLWKGDYDKCISYAEMVINHKKAIEKEEREKNKNLYGSNESLLEKRLNGYPLVNDELNGTNYGKAYESIFVKGASKESIFELNFDESPKTSGMLSNKAITSLYGHSNGDGLLVASKIVQEDIELNSGRKIFDDKNKRLDARLYLNCDGTKTSNVPIEKMSASSIDIKASNASPTATYKKYLDGENSSQWIIYRLSDVMLMEAEAYCEKMQEGSTQEVLDYNEPLIKKAFELTNVVNKRSICKKELTANDTLQLNTGATKAQMSELVKRERQRELMYEGKRWYDLVRYAMRAGNTNEIISATSKRDDVNAGFVANFFKKMDAIFWPYNLEELKVNRNLVPNPAFSSGENESMDKS